MSGTLALSQPQGIPFEMAHKQLSTPSKATTMCARRPQTKGGDRGFQGQDKHLLANSHEEKGRIKWDCYLAVRPFLDPKPEP